MRFHRHEGQYFVVAYDGNQWDAGTRQRQRPIIVPTTASEPDPVPVDSQRRHQHQDCGGDNIAAQRRCGGFPEPNGPACSEPAPV